MSSYFKINWLFVVIFLYNFKHLNANTRKKEKINLLSYIYKERAKIILNVKLKLD